MKTISVELQSHIQQDVTSLCTCWKAVLKNGNIYGFTDHTQNIIFDGLEYLADAGYTPTAISTTAKLDVDNLDVEGLLNSEIITTEDIFAGLWDYAEIFVFQINYQDLTQGVLKLRRGWLGEVRSHNSYFVAELRGLTQKLQQSIGRIFSPSCDATFADSRCKLDVLDYTFAGAVTAVSSLKSFSSVDLVEPDGDFDYGLIRWITGNNAGLEMEVKTYTVGVVALQLNMPFSIHAGDTFEAVTGCAKRFVEDCKNRFNNVINFRGFPHVPGADEVLKGPER